MRNGPTGFYVPTFGPQLIALLGTVRKPLGGGALLGEVCHQAVGFEISQSNLASVALLRPLHLQLLALQLLPLPLPPLPFLLYPSSSLLLRPLYPR